jgi:protein-disulfide isomerase
MMAQAAARKTNWFAIWTSVAVVVVLVAVSWMVIAMNNQASDPGVLPDSANIDTETGAIVFGDGPDVVETYVDFMCPYCGQFEQAEGKTIKGLIDDGSITLEVHPVAILDRLSQGTEYSSRSAAAMFSVAQADPANAYAFLEALFAQQPAEQSTGLTDAEIIQIARDAGVNVTSELEASITDGEFLDFAKAQALPEGSTGTPTLVVNDEIVQVTYDADTDIVARLG